MFEIKRALAILLLTLAVLPGLSAQKSDADKPGQKDLPSTVVTIVPQYFFVSGLRLDVDLRLKNKPRQWISFSPRIYSGNVNQNYDANTDLSSIAQADEIDHDVLTGGGLGIHHLVFLNSEEYRAKQSGIYFGYGLTYQYFRIDFKEIAWEKVIEDGLEVYKVGFKKANQQIHMGIASILGGYRAVISDNFVIDVYAGFGIRRAFISSTLPGYRSYKRYSYDYGYNGNSPQIGLRLGMIF